MRGHNICFNGEILKIIPKLSLLLLLIWSPVLALKHIQSSDSSDQKCHKADMPLYLLTIRCRAVHHGSGIFPTTMLLLPQTL